MQKQKNSFSLLYNQLWLVDDEKLKQVNSNFKPQQWLNLSNDKVKDMREQVAILMTNKVVETKKEIITIIKQSPENKITPAIMQDATIKKDLHTHINMALKNNENLIDNWDDLTNSINKCTNCNLCNGRKNVVIDRGNRNAKWMFIGEAPGENEDIQGSPFVGASGELLNKMITAMKLNPEHDVYICNVIKCRPPYNRNPEPDEVAKCNHYLLSQINLVNPDIIITLGRFASQTILNTDAAVNKLRSKAHQFNNIPVIVTFHPSYLLRNPAAKKDAWEDLQLAMKVFKN